MNKIDENFDDDEERYIHQALDLLRARYEEAAKPYLDMLAEIRWRRQPSFRMVVTAAEAEAMGFTVPDPPPGDTFPYVMATTATHPMNEQPNMDGAQGPLVILPGLPESE